MPAQIAAVPGGPTGQLYNLSNDPHEDHNLFMEYPDKVKELQALLEQIQRAHKGKQFQKE